MRRLCGSLCLAILLIVWSGQARAQLSHIADSGSSPTCPGGTTSVTVNTPTNITNDLLYATVTWYDNGPSFSTPSGWTAVDDTTQNNHHVTTFLRVSSGSLPSTFTFTFTGGIAYPCAQITSWRNVNTSAIVNVHQYGALGSGVASCPQVTIGGSQAQTQYICSCTGSWTGVGNWVKPTDQTQRGEADYTGGSNLSFYAGDVQIPTATTFGPDNAVTTSPGGYACVGAALNPLTTGGTPTPTPTGGPTPTPTATPMPTTAPTPYVFGREGDFYFEIVELGVTPTGIITAADQAVDWSSIGVEIAVAIAIGIMIGITHFTRTCSGIQSERSPIRQ